MKLIAGPFLLQYFQRTVFALDASAHDADADMGHYTAVTAQMAVGAKVVFRRCRQTVNIPEHGGVSYKIEGDNPGDLPDGRSVFRRNQTGMEVQRAPQRQSLDLRPVLSQGHPAGGGAAPADEETPGSLTPPAQRFRKAGHPPQVVTAAVSAVQITGAAGNAHRHRLARGNKFDAPGDGIAVLPPAGYLR